VITSATKDGLTGGRRQSLAGRSDQVPYVGRPIRDPVHRSLSPAIGESRFPRLLAVPRRECGGRPARAQLHAHVGGVEDRLGVVVGWDVAVVRRAQSRHRPAATSSRHA
jgi:hypothetical protein